MKTKKYPNHSNANGGLASLIQAEKTDVCSFCNLWLQVATASPV